MKLTIWWIFLASPTFVTSSHKKRSTTSDVQTFRDPSKFNDFMEEHDDNFEKALELLDEIIFGGKSNKHEKELIGVQRRLEIAQTNVDRVENSKTPTVGTLKDIYRLAIEIFFKCYEILKYILKVFPIDLPIMATISIVVNVMDQIFAVGNKFLEFRRYYKRKKAYKKRKKEKKENKEVESEEKEEKEKRKLKIRKKGKRN